MSTSKRSIIAPPEKNLRRSRTIMYVSIAVVVIAVILAVAFASRVPKTASTAPTESKIKVGDAAPEFTVSATNGQFDLKNALASGKPVFLEVFATWCPHCQREVPSINSLYKKFGDKATFISVSGSQYGLDQSSPETQVDVVNFAQQYGAQYPIAYDGTLDVAAKYLQGGFPTFVIIDKTGKVAFIGSGELPPKDLETQLDKVI